MAHKFTDEDRAAAAASRRATARDRRQPLFQVRRQLPKLFDELLKAAMGEGSWSGRVTFTKKCPHCHEEAEFTAVVPGAGLPAASRLQALTKALEYGTGRPVGLDKQPATPGDRELVEDAPPKQGISIT